MFYIIAVRKIKINNYNNSLFIIIFLFLFTTLISSVYNYTIAPLLYSFFYCIGLFITIMLDVDELEYIVKSLTKIFFILLIGAWIGFFYVQLGGTSLFYLPNPNGLFNYFYLFTFSTTNDPLRPSGIYDEPGAFSFYICLLVCLRSIFKLNNTTSIILLSLGLITQSIAHIIFAVIWLISFYISSNRSISFFKKLSILFFSIIFSSIVYLSGILDWALNRAIGYGDSPEDTGRLPAMYNVYEYISSNWNYFFFGFQSDCIDRSNAGCGELYGENFLTPLVYGGFLSSWPYYIFLLFCIILPFIKRNFFYLIGLAAILLQRPYFLEMPYSFCISMVVSCFFRYKFIPTSKYNIYAK